MSAMQDIRDALENQLKTITPAIDTAWENVNFTPTGDSPYQKPFLLPSTPLNPAYGGNFRQEVGIFQVNLYYPLSAGSADAVARAELIRAAFPRGSSFIQNTTTVTIEFSPEINRGMVVDDRYMVPVRIRWYSNLP